VVVLFLVAWGIKMTGQIFTIALIFALFFVAILLELWEIKKIGGEIKMNLEEATQEIVALKDKVAKVKVEVSDMKNRLLARIAELELALATVQLPEAAVTALGGLRADLQEIDDQNPDA
jgi:hypothetical protein